jgi:hypothetical protein
MNGIVAQRNAAIVGGAVIGALIGLGLGSSLGYLPGGIAIGGWLALIFGWCNAARLQRSRW